PSWRVSSGLGSNVSTCDGPPFMKRWITRLARAWNCGALGRSGLTLASAALAGRASKPAWAIRPPKASEPKPMPDRHRSSRRVRNASASRSGWWDIEIDLVRLINEHELVREQEHLRVGRPGGQTVVLGRAVVEEATR